MCDGTCACGGVREYAQGGVIKAPAFRTEVDRDEVVISLNSGCVVDVAALMASIDRAKRRRGDR